MGPSTTDENPALTSIPTTTPTPRDRAWLSRRLTTIMLVRVILFTLILGGTVAVNLAWGTPEELGGPYVTFLFVFIAAIYVVNILYALLLRAVTSLLHLATLQLAVDLLTSAILVHFTGGAESAFVLFFLLSPIAAAVCLDRRAAITTAAAGVATFVLVVLLGYAKWLPTLPGQAQLPWEVSPGALGRSLLINGTAMVAVAVLAGYLAEQLRFAAEKVEVQQAHIEDLTTLNVDIIRCLTSGLITVSNEGRILTMNKTAGQIFGLSHRPRGRLLTDLCPELDEVVGRSEAIRRTELSITQSGRTKLLGISISPLTDHQNQVRGRIINFQDLTAIREMEMAVKSSERLASLGRMAAGIAHEIRNPLASISGSLELLRSEDEDEDNRRLMEIALREIERLNDLITSFLTFARPKPPQLEPMDLGQEIHSLMLPMDGGAQVCPVKVVDTTPGLWVQADRDQIRGILWNLVRNAWEAGEREQVSIRVDGDQDHVMLEVIDQAAGIAGDALGQIFEPFFSTKDKGTGLGLSVVHRMVQDHRGTIRVSSDVGRGSTFVISLPRSSAGPKNRPS